MYTGVMAERRQPVTVRLAAVGRTWLEVTGEEYGVDLSTIVRAALIVARRHETELHTLIREMSR